MQPHTIIRRKELPKITGLSLATLDRMRLKRTFPEPVSLTGAQAVGWLAESIFEWLASRQPKTSGA